MRRPASRPSRSRCSPLGQLRFRLRSHSPCFVAGWHSAIQLAAEKAGCANGCTDSFATPRPGCSLAPFRKFRMLRRFLSARHSRLRSAAARGRPGSGARATDGATDWRVWTSSSFVLKRARESERGKGIEMAASSGHRKDAMGEDGDKRNVGERARA